MERRIHVLILEDNASDAELVKRELRVAGLDFTAHWATDRLSFLDALDSARPDLLLADYSLPAFDGLSALALARQRFADLPVIIMSGAVGEETAIETLRAGATDYVLKQRLIRLGPVVRRALEEARQKAERQRAETALSANEQLWATTLASIADGVIAADQAGLITFLNVVAEQLTGWTSQDAVGQPLCEVFRVMDEPAAVPGTNLSLTALRSRVGKPSGEAILIRKDGSQIPVDESVAPIRDGAGGALGVVVVFRDISERKQALDQLRRYSEHLEELVQERTAQIRRLERERVEGEKQVALGRMAARIAHEINNPLAGVKNAFTLIKRVVPPDYPHHQFVGAIDRELNRIARIVRQMFELYRPEHREPSVFTPADAVRDIATLMEGNARALAVALDVQVARAAVPVMLHEDSLRQVLFSITQNAIEASPPEGRVEIAAEVADQRLVITVKDEGPGIPDELRSKIFEPFFTTKESLASGGLGLGLSITKGLVESLGGDLKLESRPQQGTTFTLVFPLATTSNGTSHD